MTSTSLHQSMAIRFMGKNNNRKKPIPNNVSSFLVILTFSTTIFSSVYFSSTSTYTDFFFSFYFLFYISTFITTSKRSRASFCLYSQQIAGVIKHQVAVI
ncbi:hypothetical protein BC941DRAFT_418634, partial [Chlamydoabsidia padenii]